MSKIPWRQIWHAGGGTFFPVISYFIPRTVLLITAGSLAAMFVVWETFRLASKNINTWAFSYLGILLKRTEQRKPTGTTFLLISTFIIFLLFEKDIAVTALLFSAIGDPMAALVGKNFSLHENSNKTWQGSLACFFICLIIGALMSNLSDRITLPIILCGVFAATLTEALPIALDDNLTMPLSAAGAMYIGTAYFS